MDTQELECLRHEYTEVNEHIRHYATLRFAIMTVYLAAAGGLMSVSFGFLEAHGLNADHVKLAGRFGGLLTTVLFFAYELRVQSLIDFRLELGRELEQKLGYKQFAMRPSWKWYRTHYFARAYFAILVGFWVVMTLNLLLKFS